MADLNQVAAVASLATGLCAGALAGSNNVEDQKAGWDALTSIVSEKAGDSNSETGTTSENNNSGSK